MAELARGDIGDRPWGRTLAALGARGVTGQVSIITSGKLYQIAFEQGAIVGAISPLASDSGARVALTLGLVSSTQVAELSRRIQASLGRDEFDIIAEYMRIGADQAMRLRRRTIATRAARTFAIDHGDFVVEDQIEMFVVPGSEIDVRGIIYMGASQHLTEDRLASELAKLGTWFQLKPEAVGELAQFGFADAERPILQGLVAGTSLDMLERGGDPRSVRAIVYALAASGLCNTETQRPTPVPPRMQARAPTPPPVGLRETDNTIRRPSRPSSPEMQTLRRPRTADDEMLTLRQDRKLDAPTTRRGPLPTPGATAAVQQLITTRLKLVDAHADHYALLGVDEKASDEQVRKAYFQLARQLHPDRLASLGMVDENKDGQRLFAQVNAAFGVLSDPVRRTEYLGILRRGGEAAVRAEQAKADMLVTRTLDAEEAFRRGESLLRRDALPQAIVELRKAVELHPEEGDYQALLGWAEFCAAPDKQSAGQTAKGRLIKLINKAPDTATPRFYLAKVERMLGRDAEALRLFESVLQIQPDHMEATSEARILKSRMPPPGKKR